MRVRAVWLASLGVLSLVTMHAESQNRAIPNLPNATSDHGGFGLPDQRGSRLLLIPNLARPDVLKTALCIGGRRVPVQFERRQPEGVNNGRQTSSNFDRLAGSVYAIPGSSVDPEAPCFLASEALLAKSIVLSSAVPEGSGACLQRDRFATLRDRPVIQCWPLASMAPQKQIALLEFVRRGKDALASIVFVDGARTMFADFHADFRAVGEDLWRVDDGGVLSPEGLKIVCALQRGNWYALGIAWSAAEGQSLSLWIADGSDRFTKVINDYWYQAPI